MSEKGLFRGRVLAAFQAAGVREFTQGSRAALGWNLLALRAKRRSVSLSLLGSGWAAVDFVDSSLVGAFDEDFIDAYMRGAAGAPDQGFGDVFGDEGLGAFVNFLGLGGVATEADEGEFGLGDAGIDAADADAGAVKFET